MDEGNMLVADPLNIVFAIAVVEQRRALERLDDADVGPERFLQMIACRQRAGGPRRRNEGPRGQVTAADDIDDADERRVALTELVDGGRYENCVTGLRKSVEQVENPYRHSTWKSVPRRSPSKGDGDVSMPYDDRTCPSSC